VRILVVEDQGQDADIMQRGLEAEGYAVVLSSDCDDAERRALGDRVDLVLLDLKLPNGMSALDSIRREKPALPVIALSDSDGVEDKVAGLDGGASDYVTKPFAYEELSARIRAHLRGPRQAGPTVLDAAGIRLDMLTRDVTVGGDPVHLSAREFELLAFLMRHAGEVLARDQILNTVWGYDFDPGTNVVEVYVGYLRRKLATADRPAPIETVRSVGYRLVTELGR
jgi:DNA-binding response OmpR family regulator